MFSHHTRYLQVLVLFLSFSLLQCGGDDDGVGKKLKITLNPESPVVIEATHVIDPGLTTERTIDPPWIKFRYKVENRSDKTITIVNWSLVFRATKNGRTVESDPISFDTSDEDGPPFLDEIPPQTTDYETTENFYVGKLPEADSYNYTVEMKLQGWVGPYSDPEARINKTIHFTTQ